MRQYAAISLTMFGPLRLFSFFISIFVRCSYFAFPGWKTCSSLPRRPTERRYREVTVLLMLIVGVRLDPQPVLEQLWLCPCVCRWRNTQLNGSKLRFLLKKELFQRVQGHEGTHPQLTKNSTTLLWTIMKYICRLCGIYR